MGHVEASDIGATTNELFEHLFALGGRTQGENDLGLTQRRFEVGHDLGTTLSDLEDRRNREDLEST
jgi:hypothetical protein